MEICLAVDANNQNQQSINKAAELSRTCPGTRLILAGIDARQGLWRQSWPQPEQAIFVPNPSVIECGTAIRLTAAVVEQALNRSLEGYKVVVLSPERIYDALLEFLRERGIEALRSAHLCQETVHAIVGEGFLIEGLRKVYRDLADRTGPRVHVGNFADLAVQRFPELVDIETRKRIFGTKKFTNIAGIAGLKTDAYFIVSA